MVSELGLPARFGFQFEVKTTKNQTQPVPEKVELGLGRRTPSHFQASTSRLSNHHPWNDGTCWSLALARKQRVWVKLDFYFCFGFLKRTDSARRHFVLDRSSGSLAQVAYLLSDREPLQIGQLRQVSFYDRDFARIPPRRVQRPIRPQIFSCSANILGSCSFNSALTNG